MWYNEIIDNNIININNRAANKYCAYRIGKYVLRNVGVNFE